MTREEASNILDDYDVNFDRHTAEEIAEAFEVAFRALEQEPCEDYVNRQAVLNTLFYKSDNNCEVVLNKELQDRIKALPPVTPQPKTGYWNTYKITQGGIDEEWLECSECMWSNALLIPRNYCPNCGAKMVEPQEVRGKE